MRKKNTSGIDVHFANGVIGTKKGITKKKKERKIVSWFRARGEESRKVAGSGMRYHKELKDISWEIIGTNFTEPFWPFFLCPYGIFFESEELSELQKYINHKL